MTAVLDASALLAYLQEEAGADVVADAIADGVSMSAVNLAEVLSLVAGRGADVSVITSQLTARGLLGSAIKIEPFTLADAAAAASLRAPTRHLGLSLADRGCLALAQRLDLVVLTSDTAWSGVTLDGITITQIR